MFLDCCVLFRFLGVLSYLDSHPYVLCVLVDIRFNGRILSFVLYNCFLFMAASLLPVLFGSSVPPYLSLRFLFGVLVLLIGISFEFSFAVCLLCWVCSCGVVVFFCLRCMSSSHS